MLAEQINRSSIDPDEAISREEEDLLNRQRLADHIADLINNPGNNKKDSVVIGLEGEWGEGKTSLINLTLNKVRPNAKNLIVEFNPWNFSNRNKLIKDFFTAIVDELNKPGSKSLRVRIFWRIYRRQKWFRSFAKWYKRPKKRTDYLLRVRFLWLIMWILKSLVWLFGRLPWLFSPLPVRVEGGGMRNYASKLLDNSEIEVSPSASVFALLGFITFQLTGRLKFRRESDDPLEEQKEKMNKLIRGIGKRIVIVIDDIDRLDIEETKLIFKLVKLTANFPNTVFMLAYDRGRVGKRLTEETAQSKNTVIEGEEYLKKIIQQPFLVPKPDPRDIDRILHRAIDRELNLVNFKWSKEEIEKLRLIVYGIGFRNLFRTIRDIRRYINSLRLDLRIIGEEEINMGDFLRIEAIRVFAPEMYLDMGDKEPFFTGVIPFWEHNKNQNDWLDKSKKISVEVVKKAPKELQGAIKELIPQLFPRHRSRGYMPGWDVTWRKELRVCSPYHFDKYFRLAVLATHISEVQVNKFLSITDDPIAITERLGEFHGDGKFHLLLERLYDRLDELEILRLENLLVGIFDFIDDLQEPRESESQIFSNMRLVTRLVLEALERLEDSERDGFLVRLLNRVKNFLAVARIIRALIHDIVVTHC